MKFRQLPPLVKKYRRYWPLVAFAIVFGGIGIYLLAGSRAATPDSQASLTLALAPKSITLLPGEYINIAVTASGPQDTGQTTATVDYPSNQLELVAVRDLCLASKMSPISSDSTTAGTVHITCQVGQSATADQPSRALATLVFQSTGQVADAALSVRGTGNITVNGSTRSVSATAINATAHVKPLAADAHTTPRPASDYRAKPLCTSAPTKKLLCPPGLVATDKNGSPISSRDVVSGYGPREFHTAYQVPCRPGGPVQVVCPAPASYSPETMAVVETGNYSTGMAGLESDLAKYTQNFGIPACTRANGCLKAVNQQGGSNLPPSYNGNYNYDTEIAMDIDTAHAMCQTCKILIVEASFELGDTHPYETANDYAASQSNVVAVFNEWYDPSSTNDYTANIGYFDHPGVPELTPGGDIGFIKSGEDTYPGSLPNTISVGGTKLSVNADGSWAGETVWGGYAGYTYAGGAGCSIFFDAQPWQTSLANWSKIGCGSGRGFVDVSLDGDPVTGAAFYSTGFWSVNAGTSLAMPLLAGMYGVAGLGAYPSGGVGAEPLYQKFNASNSHDIVSGNDCMDGNGSDPKQCTAGPGYDLPSGLGSPKGLAGLGGPNTIGKTGDLNGDGKVNIQDLAKLLINFGKTTTVGDLNGDGKVNVQDLALLLVNFGK